MKQSEIVSFFNDNYETNNPIIIEYLNRYIHSSHRETSLKPDYQYVSYQPSWPNETVESYSVYYDNTMAYAHKSGRIVLNFTNQTMTEIGLYKFKRYLRKNT